MQRNGLDIGMMKSHYISENFNPINETDNIFFSQKEAKL